MTQEEITITINFNLKSMMEVMTLKIGSMDFVSMPRNGT